jgi:hypothetical protein
MLVDLDEVLLSEGQLGGPPAPQADRTDTPRQREHRWTSTDQAFDFDAIAAAAFLDAERALSMVAQNVFGPRSPSPRMVPPP